MRTSPRRVLPTLFAAALVVSACGGSDDEASDTDAAPVETDVAETDPTEPEPAETDEPAQTTAPADTAVPTDTAEPVDTAGSEPAETTAPEPVDTAASEPAETSAPAPAITAAPTDTAATDTAVTDLASGSVETSLVEWEIAAPAEYAAGEVTFDLTNGGEFPHEFLVIEGESYESLPLAEGGAVIEEQLPTGALIDRVPRFGPGESASLTVDLAPGSYVLVCNLGSGVNSHAGAGQRLDITVS